jgi:hypothetical protein
MFADTCLQTLAWAVIAVIHLVPSLAFFRPALLTRLYGVEPKSQVFLLLHHRAALFLGILTLSLWAVVDAQVRRAASVSAGLSMVSFLILFVQAASPKALKRIAIADAVGLPFLAFVTWSAFQVS